MAGYDSLAQRYDLDPGTLDRLNAIGGYDQEPPMDPGAAVDRGAGPGVAGGSPAAAAPYQPNPGLPGYQPNPGAGPVDVNSLPRPAPIDSTNPSSPFRKDPVHTLQNNLKPVDIAAKVEGRSPEALRADLAQRSANPTDDGGQMGATSSAPSGGAPIHAGWMPSSRQMQEQRGYSAEELQPLRDINTDRQGSMYGRMDAETEMANKQGAIDAAYAGSYAKEAEKYANRERFLADERQAYTSEQMRKLNELAVKTQQEVDPDAYMKSVGFGGQIFAALAVGMGQFGAALTGGQNAALQIVQSNIDRAIRAQEHNIAQAGKAYDHGTNLYARNLEAFGDRHQAIVATRINYLDSVKAQLEAAMQDESRPLMERKRAFAMSEKLDEDRQKMEGEFMQRAHNQVTIAQSDRFAITGGGAGATPKSLENTVQMPDGTVVQLGGPEQANTVSKTMSYHGEMQALDKRALGLRNELDKLDPATDRVKYQSAYRALELAQKSRQEAASQAAGQGVITKADAERDATVGLSYTQGFGGNIVTGSIKKHIDPSAAGDKTIGDNTINSALEQSNLQTAAIVRAHRGRIIQGAYVKDAAGQLQPRDSYTGQDPKPIDQRAPKGFTPSDPDAKVATRTPSVEETTPQAPIVKAPTTPFAMQSGGGGKRRRKK